jgi:hypothetical protein
MKIFWTAFAALAMLGFQPAAMAYQDAFSKQREPGTNPARQQAQKNSQPAWGLEGKQQGQEPKPWEVKPWEQQNATDEMKQQKATEERRRVGRKARKERLEQKNENVQDSGYPDGATQHRNKWQRYQMESERYNPGGFYQR